MPVDVKPRMALQKPGFRTAHWPSASSLCPLTTHPGSTTNIILKDRYSKEIRSKGAVVWLILVVMAGLFLGVSWRVEGAKRGIKGPTASQESNHKIHHTCGLAQFMILKTWLQTSIIYRCAWLLRLRARQHDALCCHGSWNDLRSWKTAFRKANLKSCCQWKTIP